MVVLFTPAQVSEDTEIHCISKSVPGQMEFLCPFQNQLTSVLCSFDGGDQEIAHFLLLWRVTDVVLIIIWYL